MKILRGIAIVVGVTLAGVLAPFVVRDRFTGYLATHGVCDFLASTKRIGINDQGRRDLVEAALASDLGEDTKIIVARAKTDCR